jgi:hypothetical protein
MTTPYIAALILLMHRSKDNRNQPIFNDVENYTNVGCTQMEVNNDNTNYEA